MKLKDTLFIMLLVGILSLAANLAGYNNGIMESLPGMVILIDRYGRSYPKTVYSS
ncbi:MAG: hypothetical protein ACOWWO_11490 [Peptococcaceae bacterium]